MSGRGGRRPRAANTKNGKNAANGHRTADPATLSRRRDLSRAGFPIARLNTAAVDTLFDTLAGTPPPRGRAAKRRDALAALLRDGARWEGWLEELPALSLLVLELLVEGGGGLEIGDLVELLVGRVGCTEEQAEVACGVLFRRHLVLPLGSGPTDREAEAMCVLEGSLPPLEARLRGLSLPDRPAELSAGSDHSASDTGVCWMLAVAGLTAHRTLGFTRSGMPHRGTLKRFARGLGVSQDEAFGLALRARYRGLLRAFGKRLLPSGRSMRAVARAGTDGTDFAGWLEPGVWVSEQALVRALTRACIDASPSTRPDGDGVSVVSSIDKLDARSRGIVDGLEGLERLTLDGEVWLRPSPPPPEERSGDGHVTPSFEVMLGPAAHPEIVATISLGCELQRIDRVLSFKITPDSVRQGRVAGLREGELCAALAAVGRHPVPDTVVQLVGEWEQAGRVAPIARGWFLFAGRELAPLLEKGELAPHLLGSPMEGVLELAPTTPHDVIATALAEHRITPALSYPLEEANRQRDSGVLANPLFPFPSGPWEPDPDDAWATEPDEEGYPPSASTSGEISAELLARFERPWPLEPGGSPALRERVAAARTDGFVQDLAQAETAELLLPAGIEGAPDATPAEIVARLLALESALSRLESAGARELDRFARKLDGPGRAALEAARAIRLTLIPFLALKPKWRRRLVQTADDLDELLAFTEEASEPQRLTPEGREVLEMLEDPLTHAAALQVASEGDDGITASVDPPGRSRGGSRPRPATIELKPSKGGREVSLVFDDEATSAPLARPLPRADDFPELDRFELMARLSGAVETRRPIYLSCETEGRRSVRHVTPDRIEIQGNRQVLLCQDCETGEDRALPVQGIRSLMS
mgnify:CR=1 FL=1